MPWEPSRQPPQRQATSNQITYITSMMDELEDRNEISDVDALEFRAYMADDTSTLTFQWASETIEDLREQLEAARKRQGNEAIVDGSPIGDNKGRLAARERIQEDDAERVKRIYRCAWSLRGLSQEGFYKRWSEVGPSILQHHGVTTTQEDPHYTGYNPLNQERMTS